MIAVARGHKFISLPGLIEAGWPLIAPIDRASVNTDSTCVCSVFVPELEDWVSRVVKPFHLSLNVT